MVNKIIKKIAGKLADNFTNCRVYTEFVEQGFKEPCFQIQCVEINNSLYLGRRYKSENTFEIRFYSKDERYSKNQVVVRLFELLELLEMENGLIRGTKMSMETKEDYVAFKVSYDGFFVYTQEKEPMEKYSFNIKKEMF